MEDIEQLSKKLLKSDDFIKELKQRIEQISKSRNVTSDQQVFIESLPQSQTLQISQKLMQMSQEPRFLEQRPSITSSAFQKRESRDSISSLNSNPIFQQYIQTYSMSQEHTINALTSQISNCIGEMIKKQIEVLNEIKTLSSPIGFSKENLSQLIENMQILQKQQSDSLKQSFQQKISALKSQIQEQVTSIIQKIKLQRKIKKINEKSSQIKKQRKKVTESILELSKSNQQMSTFSNMHENILSESQQEQQTSIRRNSPQISQLSSKITQVQRSQIKISKQFEQRFLKQVEQNKKDIQQLTQKIIEWKLKNEQKLENGFTGVWNIVTDIQDKMNKVTLRVVEIQHSLS